MVGFWWTMDLEFVFLKGKSFQSRVEESNGVANILYHTFFAGFYIDPRKIEEFFIARNPSAF